MLLVLPVPLAKMDQRVLEVMLDLQEDREMLDSVDLLAHRERKASLENLENV